MPTERKNLGRPDKHECLKLAIEIVKAQHWGGSPEGTLEDVYNKLKELREDANIHGSGD